MADGEHLAGGGPAREQASLALRTALSFASLDDETLSRLAQEATPRTVPAGTVIFEKGSPADGLYVVVSGSVRIVDAVHGKDVEIAVIRPGDFFGEVSLALDTARTRAAQAKEETELIVVPFDAFTAISASHPHLPAQLLQAYGERIGPREGDVE
jgi:CRP-like cAMP-binding protein